MHSLSTGNEQEIRHSSHNFGVNVSQVPAALKSLYSDPLPEALEAPPLSESLLGAAEVCEWWREEEKRRRREFAALTSSSAQLLPPTHHQDEVWLTCLVQVLDREGYLLLPAVDQKNCSLST